MVVEEEDVVAEGVAAGLKHPFCADLFVSMVANRHLYSDMRLGRL